MDNNQNGGAGQVSRDDAERANEMNGRHVHVHVHLHDEATDPEARLVDSHGRPATQGDDAERDADRNDGGKSGDKDKDKDKGSGKDGKKEGDEKNDDGEDDDEKSDGKDGKNGGGRKRPGKKPLIFLAVAVVVVIIVAIIMWLNGRNKEGTDDAFTDGDVVTMAPKVSGYVTRLAVRDNQRVKKGDLLLQIDPRDYIAQRDQAQAQVGLAEAQLHQAEAQLALARVQYPAQLQQARAQQQSAEANLANANSAYQRQRGVDPRATSQQNIDTATAQQRSARADVSNARAQVSVASKVELQVRQAETAVEARQQQVQQAKAQLEVAELNLSYTELRAPSDGYITRRNVQLGSLVQAGTSLLSLVTRDIYITANFKESQLQHMRVGNKVAIKVDAYPDLDLEGHVDSIQQGSGSRFSAFPAENATGNYVKIVQRVPVKIVIDRGLKPDVPLPIGLSVEPKVFLE
ncbi:HlyD family secretion protein [Chitinasiproducens palmae]|uniref:Membrane fusion protein, multidrug efflux system n=1 Tax=Chitinasiproducens palmae TaxID=1770053 RepID=A0A1H2PRU4_9BURK|nr:HlyD family secretion protein [Chitinasiproducens palmae]SDV49641.1 membrane fusion protein, multidrug efflux system [Chitinasiproducens palmae]